MTAVVLWAADRRVEKDDGTPATTGTLTVRLADTSTTATAYTDRDLTTTQSVYNIGSDGYLESRVTIYGRADVGYDAYISSTGVNGSSAWTIPDLWIADTSIADESNTAIALKNAIPNGDLALWTPGTSYSNISGSNNAIEVADSVFFIQSTAASNAISQQSGFAVGVNPARARYALRFGRPASSTSTNKLRVAGLIPVAETYRLRSQQITLSFDAVAGANFSGGSLAVKVSTGTTESESITLIEASGFAGNANPISSAASVSTTAARYEYTATLASGIKEIGWQLSYTGSGTAGANDWVSIQNIQLEIASSATEFTAGPEILEYVIARDSAGMRLVLATSFTDPGADRMFGWDDSAGAFIGFGVGGALSISGTTISVTAADILTQILTVDGAGSGLDADLLDGNSSAYFTGYTDTALANHVAAGDPHTQYVLESAYTASDVLAKLVTVDGAGSGLDADLLDGNSSAYFATASGLSDHLNDTSAAHAASAISYNGGTGISATDVEGAIDELATEKLDAASYTAADVLSKLLTVDGSGSGLDADLLDGKNIGTSGNAVPLLDGTNTWSAEQLFGAGTYVKGGSSYRGISNASNTYASAGAILIWGGSGDAHTYLSALTGSNVIIRANGLAGTSLQIADAALTWNGNTIFTTAGGTFTGGITGTTGSFSSTVTAGDLSISSTYPIATFYDTDSGTNEKGWSILGSGGYLQFAPRSDAFGFGTSVLVFTRSGTTNTIAEFDEADLRMEPSPASLATNSVGFRGFGAPSAKTANYTFVLGDAGQMIRHNSASSHNFTIPTQASVAYPDGTGLPVENVGAGTMVLVPDTGVTLLDDAGTSGSVTLNQHQGGVLERDATSGTNYWRYRGTHA